MIRFIPGNYERADWDAEVMRLDGASLLQSWEWGTAKTEGGAWSVERGILAEDDCVAGAAQVMVRNLPMIGGGLAWVARGPLYIAGEAARYPALLEALRRYYVDERRLHLRIAPARPAGDADEKAFRVAGFRPAGVSGWVSAAVDLSLPIEALRYGLAQKWRNALNKAERLGLTVENVSTTVGFDTFLAEYGAFLDQRGFVTSVTPNLLAVLQKLMPETRKMAAWRCTHEGASLGGALIARYGDRAEYLVGTLSDAGRRYAAGQLLLWRALLAERESGLRWFDLGGMDPSLTSKGILDFKGGLGGMPYQLADEIEADDSGLRARLVRWRVARARNGAGATA